MNKSPRDIAWEVIAEHFNADTDHTVFVPLASANEGLNKIAQKAKNSQLLCYQTFKPEVDALKKLGITCQQKLPETCDEVLFVPSKQKIESLGFLAFSLLNLKVGGQIIYCCHNELGAGGFNNKIKEIFPDLEIESAKKCRYVVFKMESALNADQKMILNSWIEAAAPSQVPATEYKSIPGIFGWNKVDKGSELLVSSLTGLNGKGADLGCGYGYLSHQIFSRFKDVESLSLVEAEQRALDCARDNLKEWNEKCVFHWLDVCADESRKIGSFDWIVMNPPFHDENLVDQDLGKEFIQTASQLLRKGGSLFMVANEFLAYEKLLKGLFSKVDLVLTQDGFKVIHAKR